MWRNCDRAFAGVFALALQAPSAGAIGGPRIHVKRLCQLLERCVTRADQTLPPNDRALAKLARAFSIEVRRNADGAVTSRAGEPEQCWLLAKLTPKSGQAMYSCPIRRVVCVCVYVYVCVWVTEAARGSCFSGGERRIGRPCANDS